MSVNVITGSPSCGKSSTMRMLLSRGYRSIPESARLVIDQAVSEGIPSDKVRDELDFQQELIAVNKSMEESLIDDEIYFLDRSLADNLAYMSYPDREIPDVDFIEDVKDRYDNVFYLEQLPFEDDYARKEDSEKEAKEMGEQVRWVYEELGYDVVDVPLMPVNRRADLIERYALSDNREDKYRSIKNL